MCERVISFYYLNVLQHDQGIQRVGKELGAERKIVPFWCIQRDHLDQGWRGDPSKVIAQMDDF